MYLHGIRGVALIWHFGTEMGSRGGGEQGDYESWETCNCGGVGLVHNFQIIKFGIPV